MAAGVIVADSTIDTCSFDRTEFKCGGGIETAALRNMRQCRNVTRQRSAALAMMEALDDVPHSSPPTIYLSRRIQKTVASERAWGNPFGGMLANTFNAAACLSSPSMNGPSDRLRFG